MAVETIKNYVTGDIGASQSPVTLEDFIGDMDNAELADDSTVDVSDAVTAINALIFSLESRDAEIERLNKWADGFSDAQLKERRLCEDRIREMKTQIDKYGLRLMMIREGCADPSGTAAEILIEYART